MFFFFITVKILHISCISSLTAPVNLPNQTYLLSKSEGDFFLHQRTTSKYLWFNHLVLFPNFFMELKLSCRILG